MAWQHIRIARFGGPEVLELAEQPTIPDPGSGEVRIKVLAAGTGFTDTFIRRGRYPDFRGPLPFTPGYDLVGVVEKTGVGAPAQLAGQLVADLSVVDGYAQYAIRPARFLVPVPDSIDPAKSCCYPGPRRNFRCWHKADISFCTANVRFRGSSGHHSDEPKCPLMTQSGRHTNMHFTSVRLRLFPSSVRLNDRYTRPAADRQRQRRRGCTANFATDRRGRLRHDDLRIGVSVYSAASRCALEREQKTRNAVQADRRASRRLTCSET